MELYLVQHGEAKPKEEDPERPLTERGRAEAERMAAWARRAGLEVERIVHSGKTRAAETAGLLAAALEPREVGAWEGLGPKDDVRATAGRLLEAEGSLLIVGHLPHLARLASLCLAGRAESTVVRFRNAGVVGLSRDGGAWSLRFAVTPELLGEG